MRECSAEPQHSKWRRIQGAFFFLLVPVVLSLDDQSLNRYVENGHYLSFGSEWQVLKSLSPFFPADKEEKTVDEFGSDATAAKRNLKSSSESGDGDDYWRQPDDFYFRDDDEDDDFYKYIGDLPTPRLLPLTRRDVIGFMLSSLGVTLGSSGGIGGGGMVVPIYIVVFGLPPRFAIPLGSITVFGGSLAGLILNSRRRHPIADRPIIDWDLILVMEPLVLVGALLGTIFHRIISEKILTVLLVLLLSIVAQTTLAKARRMYEAEMRYLEHLKARWDYLGQVGSMGSAFGSPSSPGWSAEALGAPTAHDPENKTNSPVGPSSPLRTLSIDSRDTIRHMDRDEKQRILILNPDFVTLRTDILEQEKVTPKAKIIALVAKFSVLIFLNATLGGGGFRSPWGILCGSVAFWVVHVIMVAFLFSSAWAAQTYLINRHELKEIVRFDYVHGDIKWDPRNSVIYPFFFMCSGLCAGMFGVGGGIITTPLMLAMGVHPAVVTATSSAMIFFTALLSASSFAVFNLILWDYAVVCVTIGFLASLMGQFIMRSVRRSPTEGNANFERNSFIAYCIGCVILLSALFMTMQYVYNIVTYDQTSGTQEGGLCEGYRMY